MMQSQLTLSQASWGVGCLEKDHNHLEQNKIIEICMKQGCTLPNILCTFCKKLHNDHREKLVSIAEIEDEFKNAQQNNESKKLLLLINEFEQFAKNQLDVMVKKMKLLDNPFNVLESIIIQNKQQSYYQLKDQVSELVKLIEVDNFKVKFKQPNKQEINIEINNLTNEYLQEITNFMKLHGIIIQQQQQQQQDNIVSILQRPKIKDLHFLQENCGLNIKCVSLNCVRNNQGISVGADRFKHYMAYLNRDFQQSEGASLVFKINSISYGIGIGICQFEKASKQNNESYYGFGSRLYFAKGRKDFKMEKGKKISIYIISCKQGEQTICIGINRQFIKQDYNADEN